MATSYRKHNDNSMATIADERQDASSPTVVLITGANRGLGLGILKRYIALPDHTVIALNRNPSKSDNSRLIDLTENHGIRPILTSSSPTSAWPRSIPPSSAKPSSSTSKSNTLSAVAVYQATRELLKRSPLVNPSALPWVLLLGPFRIRINEEDQWLNSFVLDPGWVQTNTGNAAAELRRLEAAPLTVDVSCDGMFDVLRKATKEKYGGKSVLYTGDIQAW
ncbi:hypothetical protein QBC43DRAFT_344550 [Cladorrhinum sp. PSN259]|nr:hypothetical protein QBC43DRAFT_344550 [Cladorrhinum sp. PSN259]